MQTITSQTSYPLRNGGNVQVQSFYGRIKAVVVLRSTYDANPQLASSMLMNAIPTTMFTSTLGGYGDYVLLVQPVDGRATIRIDKPYGLSGAYAMAYAEAAKGTLKTWWDSQQTLYKWIIGIVAVLIVLLIIWAIWWFIKKNKSSSPSFNTTYY